MKRFLLPALLSICFLSCSDDSVENSLVGSWTVVSFENLTAGTTEFKTQENSWDLDINVRFDNSANPNTISGKNTTNTIRGEFSFVSPNQFRVSSLASTFINQPRWANEFVVALNDQNLTFEIVDNQLLISYSNNTKRVTLQRD